MFGGSGSLRSLDRILLSAFEFDVYAVIKESRYFFTDPLFTLVVKECAFLNGSYLIQHCSFWIRFHGFHIPFSSRVMAGCSLKNDCEAKPKHEPVVRDKFQHDFVEVTIVTI